MLVERNFSEEGTDLRQHLIVRLTQGRGIAQGIEMRHEAPGFVQFAGRFVETEHDGVEVHFAAILVDECVEIRLCLFQGSANVGFDVVWGQC